MGNSNIDPFFGAIKEIHGVARQLRSLAGAFGRLHNHELSQELRLKAGILEEACNKARKAFVSEVKGTVDTLSNGTEVFIPKEENK